MVGFGRSLMRLIKIILIGLLGLGIYFVFKNSKEQLDIETYQVTLGDVSESIILDGTVGFTFQENIILKQPAQLISIDVEDGQWVVEGTLLASFQSENLKTELEQKQAQFELHQLEYQKLLAGMDKIALLEIEKNYQIAKNLFEKFQKEESYQKDLLANGFLSEEKWNEWLQNQQKANIDFQVAKEKYENTLQGPDEIELKMAKAKLANTKMELDQLEVKYQDLKLKAPFDGKIIDLLIHPSDISKTLDEGTSLMLLANTKEDIQVSSEVYESQLDKLNKGDLVTIFVGNQKQEFSGILKHKGNQSTTTTGPKRYLVDFDIQSLKQKEIPYRSRAEIHIQIGQAHQVPIVPLKFIFWKSKQAGVWIKEKSNMIFKEIKTGFQDQEFIEVKSGVKPGDIIYLKYE